MSGDDLFSEEDPYGLIISEDYDADYDCEIDITDDEVREMLFDDDIGTNALKTGGKKKSGQQKNSLVVSDKNNSTTSSKSNASNDNSIYEESGGSRLNSSVDRSPYLSVDSVRKSSEEEDKVTSTHPDDEDDEEEEEERHAKFRSERAISQRISSSKHTSKEIPDSLESVLVSESHSKSKYDKREVKSNRRFPPVSSQLNTGLRHSQKILVNPHFRPAVKPLDFNGPTPRFRPPMFLHPGDANRGIMNVPVSSVLNNMTSAEPVFQNNLNTRLIPSSNSMMNAVNQLDNVQLRQPAPFSYDHQLPLTDRNSWTNVYSSEVSNQVWNNPIPTEIGNQVETARSHVATTSLSHHLQHDLHYNQTPLQTHPQPFYPSSHTSHQRPLLQQSHQFINRFPQQSVRQTCFNVDQTRVRPSLGVFPPLPQHDLRFQPPAPPLPLPQPSLLFPPQHQLLADPSRHQETFQVRPRFLPADVYQARFLPPPPQFHSGNLNTFRANNNPNCEPAILQPRIPTSPLERNQVPRFSGQTRTLLPYPHPTFPMHNIHPSVQPKPMLMQQQQQQQQHQHQHQQLVNTVSRNLTMPKLMHSSDFGLLQRSNEQLRDDPTTNASKRVCGSNQNSPPQKFIRNANENRLLSSRFEKLHSSTTGSPSSTVGDGRKIALQKARLAKRILQKRPTSSLKVIKIESEHKSITASGQNNKKVTMNKNTMNSTQVTSSVSAPKQIDESLASDTEKNSSESKLIVDLVIDEEYQRKLQEQKRMREEFLKRKEERRRMMALQKQSELDSSKNTSLVSNQSQQPSAEAKTVQESTKQNRKVLTTNTTSVVGSKIGTVVNRFPNRLQAASTVALQSNSSENARQVVQLNTGRRINERKTVRIRGMALTTTPKAIEKLSSSIGKVEKATLIEDNGEKIATITFASAADAVKFQQKYQRYLLDLCVIQVTLV